VRRRSLRLVAGLAVATALVGGLDAPSRAALTTLADTAAGALVFALASEGEEPVHRNVFQVTATPARRRAALERWPGKGPRAGLRVVEWHPALVRYGALELNQRFTARFHQPMAPLAWAGWVAVKAWAELSLRAGTGDPVDRLLALRFDGHKGVRLRFDPRTHELVQPLYVVGPDGKLLGEVPPEEGP